MLRFIARLLPWFPWPWLPLGLKGERVAAIHIRRLGYKILYRSYRCSIGEIDLVALDQGTLVFVEVRTRSNTSHGEAWETIGPIKQGKLSALANYFLKHERRWSDYPARFDVVSVEWPSGSENVPRITLYRDSFSVRGKWLNG